MPSVRVEQGRWFVVGPPGPSPRRTTVAHHERAGSRGPRPGQDHRHHHDRAPVRAAGPDRDLVVPGRRPLHHHRHPRAPRLAGQPPGRPEADRPRRRADLPATAVEVTDPPFRRRFFTQPETSWYGSQAELDRLVAEAPMVELTLSATRQRSMSDRPIVDLLIDDAWLVATLDPGGRELPGGWVAITGGLISGVGSSTRPPTAGDPHDLGRRVPGHPGPGQHPPPPVPEPDPGLRSDDHRPAVRLAPDPLPAVDRPPRRGGGPPRGLGRAGRAGPVGLHDVDRPPLHPPGRFRRPAGGRDRGGP